MEQSKVNASLAKRGLSSVKHPQFTKQIKCLPRIKPKFNAQSRKVLRITTKLYGLAERKRDSHVKFQGEDHQLKEKINQIKERKTNHSLSTGNYSTTYNLSNKFISEIHSRKSHARSMSHLSEKGITTELTGLKKRMQTIIRTEEETLNNISTNDSATYELLTIVKCFVNKSLTNYLDYSQAELSYKEIKKLISHYTNELDCISRKKQTAYSTLQLLQQAN